MCAPLVQRIPGRDTTDRDRRLSDTAAIVFTEVRSNLLRSSQLEGLVVTGCANLTSWALWLEAHVRVEIGRGDGYSDRPPSS